MQQADEDRLFEPGSIGQAICDRVLAEVRAIGPAEVRVSKSAVTVRRRAAFAMIWPPGRYVRSRVPAVLSIAAPLRIESDRFKEVVRPAQRVWMHHLELEQPGEVDAEVVSWLRTAYDAAGESPRREL
jgi:hypothetical protein